MTGHVLMPSMAHVGISLPHPLTFSSAGLASSQAGVDPTVHLLGFCTWSAKCGWGKSTEPCEWLFSNGKSMLGNISEALLLPDSPSSLLWVLPPVFHSSWSKLFPLSIHATLLPASALEIDLDSLDQGRWYEYHSLNLPISLSLTSIFSFLSSFHLKSQSAPLLPKALEFTPSPLAPNLQRFLSIGCTISAKKKNLAQLHWSPVGLTMTLLFPCLTHLFTSPLI